MVFRVADESLSLEVFTKAEEHSVGRDPLQDPIPFRNKNLAVAKLAGRKWKPHCLHTGSKVIAFLLPVTKFIMSDIKSFVWPEVV